MTSVASIEALPKRFRMLVDADPATRARAVARQRADWAVADRFFDEQRRLSNEHWLRDPLAPYEPEELRQVQLASDRGRQAASRTLTGNVAVIGRPEASPRAEACSVLFLQWEADYFEEWATTRAGAPVGLKERVLTHFRRRGVPPKYRSAMVELTLASASRGYRCEDRGYARLVRHLDGEDFRRGLDKIVATPVAYEPVQAFYLLALLENPGATASRHSWRVFRSEGQLPA